MHTPSRFPLRATIAVAGAAVLLASAPAAYASDDAPAVQITEVGGQQVDDGRVADPLSGQVTARGTADPVAPAPARELIADAGDSAFVAAGERAVLLGAAYGGSAPYTFAWSAEHGKLTDPSASSTELDTSGLNAGTYPVRLRVTDAKGATVTDTVLVVVHQVRRDTLLDETRADTTPGTVATGERLEFPIEVPAGLRKLTVDLSFTEAANDYDLELYAPGADEPAATSGSAAGEPEHVAVDKPEAGAWKAVAVKWAVAVPNDVRVVAVGEERAPDPRPVVDAGGPYAFTPGEPQQLTGSVSGGTAAWDLDADGRFETTGAEVTAELSEGRHLVTLKATDAQGLERRETTSVVVADPAVIDTLATPLTVIGVADTGINPYHLEFSAQAYPDPDVLALTRDFTRHPSEYIEQYPQDAQALEVTLGQGYKPAADDKLWDGNETIKAGELYWIPGTKIIGAIDAGGSTGATSGEDAHPILDDNGHGSGSASVSAGNRYGYCPTCLLVVVEALDETVVAELPWVDISTNSFGYVGGAPVGPVVDGSAATKAAAERGQTTLFAAGNGIGNAFDVPVNTWHSDQTGPDWNITVGAIRRDNQRAIVGDGIPVHVSSWGDGNLPSACGKGTVGQCAFGGTSAATPYTAGVFGTTLSRVRAAVGDGAAGQRPGQAVAVGIERDDSVYLADGKLTRDELRQAVLKSALPLGQENEPSPFPYPLTAPYTGESNVLFEGYGAATPAAADRATDVLLGKAQLPERPFEDEFFAYDRAVRDTLWGGYDRDGDGDTDSEALTDAQLDEAGMDLSSVRGLDGTVRALGKLAKVSAPAAESTLAELGDDSVSYYLHRRAAGDGCANSEQYMTRQDSAGDLEQCFDSRVTSVVAAFRPVGIFAAEDTLDAPLPKGSTVNVELYLAGETPAMVRPTGVLVATDREIGTGQGMFAPVVGTGPGGAACDAAGEQCWTKYQFTFQTTRPAFTGEQLTFQVQLLGARSWAFGFEGDHASKIAIDPAPLPDSGLEFGVTVDSPADGSSTVEGETVVAGGSYDFPDLGQDPTGAGDHPTTRRVEVSVDDPSFAEPREAVLDKESGTWRLKAGELAVGEHTIYARARIDHTTSDAAASRFTVRPDAEVQWQVVNRNGATSADGWQPASGLEDWSFTFDTTDYRPGGKTLVVRVVRHAVELARDTVRLRFG